MQEKFRRRRLPHWDLPGATYFITACLAGSIPAEGLLDISDYRTSLAKRPKPDRISQDDWKVTCWKQTFARWDEWLNRRPATRHLADPALAAIVVDSFYFFAGERYDLLAYVVMPSHIHWVFKPRREWAEKLSDDRSPREVIMHSLKLHTALECNERLHLTGAFWQDESHDHCVSDEDELWRIIEYVELNPVKAGLAVSRDVWPFSSGHGRAQHGIPFGQPLLRL
jgi:REP element-mobilizing transposase RayT